MDGFLVVDKPTDWTSHDVCAFVKGRFKLKKVGHAGTLDPLATGVLVLLLGKGTKQSALLSANDKEYEGVLQLGVETDSHDAQGEIIKTAPWESVTLEALREKSEIFKGEIEQIPPMVSAVKHKGRRLYQLARKGVSVEREPRPATVERFDLFDKKGANVSFKVSVSKGTYVRTLVHDLGKSVGCCAMLTELRRTRSGKFNIEQAVTIENLKETSLEDFHKKIIPLGSISEYADLQKH